MLDSYNFSDPTADSAHRATITSAVRGTGALGQPMQRFLPLSPQGPYGGEMKFTMTVDPAAQNYVSIKLWGEDYNEHGRHVLEVEGLELGGRRTPVIDQWGKVAQGRFWLRTVALPLYLTRGRSKVNLRLRSMGTINPYAALQWSTYQADMKQPSQPIYGIWTHTDPYLKLPASEQIAAAPVPVKFATETRSVAQLLAGVKSNQEKWLNDKLASKALLTIDEAKLLAYAYIQGTQLSTYKNAALLDRFIKDTDRHIARFYANPDYAAEAWGGSFHGTADALLKVWGEAKSRFDESIDVGTGTPVKRREAWAKAFRYGMDVERKARRTITNQILEANIGIYRANRALMLLEPTSALPEAAARRYIDEAAGLLPFSGADLADGSSAWPYGRNYWSVNAKGTSREPGWVGSDYGGTVFFAQWFWELTGDTRFRDKGLAIAHARAMTSYFAPDEDGESAMRIADPINTRNDYLPGRVVDYADFPFAAASLDPTLLGYVQQQIDEGQFWSRYWRTLDFRFLDLWARFAAQPRTNIRMPYSPDQPDGAWADEDDYIVTVKRGDEFLAVNMFHRPNGIDGRARVFLQSPQGIRHGDIQVDDVAYLSTGRYLSGDGLVDSILTLPPDNPVSANFGVRTMLATGPDGDCDAGPCWGRPKATSLRFGNYLIGMNSSSSLPYTMKLPPGFREGTDMITGSRYHASVVLPPRTTVVFYLDTLPVQETPGRPMFVTAAPGNATIALAWDAAAGAQSYNVSRANDADGAYAEIASGITSLSYIDRTASPGVTYRYVVSGVNKAGRGGGSAELAATAASSSLPAPWSDRELTARTLKGAASFAADTLTIKTASYSVLGDTNKGDDDVFLVPRPWVGDATVTVRVTTATKPLSPGGQSALFLRSSLDTDAAGAAIFWRSDNKVRMGYRAVPGGRTSDVKAEGACSLPCWLRLTRQDRTVTGYASSDGVAWHKIGEVKLHGLTDSMHVGPAATGNYGGGLSTSVFDSIEVR